jgi:thiamine-monophosphate kinase
MSQTLSALGETAIIEIIKSYIPNQHALIGGIGHDAGFLNMNVNEDEVISVNTDRSGINVAYKLGLSDAKCVGDFGICHSVSDLVAAGSIPQAVSIALLLPGDLTADFIHELMKGIISACERYNLTITGGDTKKSDEFAMVVTAIGKCKKNEIVPRSGAQVGDLLVVTDYLGVMLTAITAFKNELSLTEEQHELLMNKMVCQRPPFELGLEMNRRRIINACTDISDGLPAAIYNICKPSNTGAVIHDNAITGHPVIKPIVDALGLPNIDLASAGGDWAYLYAVSPENINQLMETAAALGLSPMVIGECLESRDIVIIKDGINFELINNENDSFAHSHKGKGHFSRVLSGDASAIGKALDKS